MDCNVGVAQFEAEEENRLVGGTFSGQTTLRSCSGVVRLEMARASIEQKKQQTPRFKPFRQRQPTTLAQPSFMDKITVHGPVTKVDVQEVHQVDVKKSSGPGKLLSTAIAIGITYLTKGMDGGLLAQAVTSAVATQLTIGTLSNDFNPVTAVKQMMSQEGIKSLGAQVATNVLVGGAPSIEATPLQIVQHNALRTVVGGAMNVAFGQQKLDEVLQNAGVNFVFDVVGQIGARYIGDLYNNGDNGQINYAEHKLMHAALGAGLGAMKGDVIAGAIGGTVAEVVAGFMAGEVDEITERVMKKADREGIPYNSPRFQKLIDRDLRATKALSKLAAATVVGLADHNIDIGLDVATNALENNIIPHIIMAVVMGAEFYLFYQTADLAASAIRDVYNTHQQDGPTAAVNKLVDAGVIIAAGSLGFKVAGVYCANAKLAWKAYVEATPQLKGLITKGREVFGKGKAKTLPSSSMTNSSSSLIPVSSVPLITSQGVPNAGGYINSFITTQEEVYYRVYSGTNT